jgi:CheY-like chemotaxis protein
VLLVDDDSINQLVVRGMLLKLGYRVRTADALGGALELLREQPVDAVLLDCQVSVLAAQTFRNQARSLPGCAGLPVLLALATPLGGERSQADSGAECLAKPVKFEELQAVLFTQVLCSEQGESAGV